ncbi:MAG: peptidylprolyl isomerase [Lentisphaeria bacterium]|nr:peptidylprolyl isomerase [Lentisphaeria bacterium]
MALIYAVVGLLLLLFVGTVCFSLGGRHRRKPPEAPERSAAAPTPSPAQPAVTTPAPEPALPTDAEEIRKLLSVPTNPVVRISTGKGDMLCELFEDKVPNTVANMVELADKGFYKGMTFHRVIPDFMAQGGCPNSKKGAAGTPGTGDPGYRFADEFDDTLKHTGRGIISMANSGPDTNGSQFFLCFRATPHLDGKHSVFGKVIAGQTVIDRLEKIGTPSGTPKEDVRLNVEVVLKQDHSYSVRKL